MSVLPEIAELFQTSTSFILHGIEPADSALAEIRALVIALREEQGELRAEIRETRVEVAAMRERLAELHESLAGVTEDVAATLEAVVRRKPNPGAPTNGAAQPELEPQPAPTALRPRRS